MQDIWEKGVTFANAKIRAGREVCIYGMYGRPGIFSKCGIHAGAAA